MNKRIKEGLNDFAKGISSFFRNLGETVASLLRIIVLSRCRVACQSRRYKGLKQSGDCCVLGNGPSLKADFEAGRVLIDGKDLLCVNMFCLSPLFRELKPRFYFLVDGAYFAPQDERNKKLVEELKTAFASVDWEMYLFVPSSAVSGGELLESLTNPNVKVLRMNSASVAGFKSFRHWVYRHRMGMPRCQTVANFALCSAIDMGYENIYLYGADHTWTRDLFVDDDNVVCYGDRHLYNNNLTIIKKEENFASLLGQFAEMFQSHYLLEDYSKSVGVKILNCSSDSYLDAYERMK